MSEALSPSIDQAKLEGYGPIPRGNEEEYLTKINPFEFDSLIAEALERTRGIGVMDISRSCYRPKVLRFHRFQNYDEISSMVLLSPLNTGRNTSFPDRHLIDDKIKVWHVNSVIHPKNGDDSSVVLGYSQRMTEYASTDSHGPPQFVPSREIRPLSSEDSEAVTADLSAHFKWQDEQPSLEEILQRYQEAA